MNEFVYRNKKSPENEGKGTHGLKNRFEEQVNGRCRPGTDGWRTHDDQIRGLQGKLARYSQKYLEKCGEPPPEILDYATRPHPKKDDWKGNWDDPVPPECNKVPVNVPVTVPVPKPVETTDTEKTLIAVAVAAATAVAVVAVVATAPATATAAAAVMIVVGLGSLLDDDDGASPSA